MPPTAWLVPGPDCGIENARRGRNRGIGVLPSSFAKQPSLLLGLGAQATAMTTSMTMLTEDVPGLLRECCRLNVSAVVALPSYGVAAAARFTGLTVECLILEILGDDQHLYRPPVTGIVSFQAEGRACVFISPIVQHRHELPMALPEVFFDLPSAIVIAQTRRHFRVPVVEGAGLNVLIEKDRDTLPDATPLDVSMGGLLVAFSPEDGPELAVGNLVDIELELGKDVVKCKGEIRHCASGKYGVMLRTDRESEQLLGRIVARLERKWLQERAAALEVD